MALQILICYPCTDETMILGIRVVNGPKEILFIVLYATEI
jgi:hypothetical protein